MPAHEPQQLHHLIAEAVTRGDLPAYLALYQPDAALSRRGGGVAVGLEQIQAEIAPFMAFRGTLSVTTASVVQTGSIALLHSRGAYRGVAPDGSPVEVPEHDAAEVAARQPDGTWLFVVNDPWGPQA